MKLGSKEHYEILEGFERSFRGTYRLDREEDKNLWKMGRIYQNGETNKAYIAFFNGYAFAKAKNELII